MAVPHSGDPYSGDHDDFSRQCPATCRPVAFLLTGGQVADCTAADALLDRMRAHMPVIARSNSGDGIRMAQKLGADLWHTQDGPVHNAEQQILDVNGEPIPRLYAAGELGSAFAYLYVSGGNLTECFYN